MSYNKNKLKHDSNVFSWSPLPPRRDLRFTSGQDSNFNVSTEKLYPNTDINVWLRSCEQEIPEPLNGNVTGHIPVWLSGTLIRNGPGSLKAGQDEFHHLFDSSALLHRFSIENGNVTYQCKFLKTNVYRKNWEANRIVVTDFGTSAVPDPCQSIFRRITTMFQTETLSDNANISVYPFGDKLYAFAEIPIIHEVNAENLQTQNKVDISKYVSIVHHTSHPHIVNGTVYNLGMSITFTGPQHNIICFPPMNSNETNISMFETSHIVASIPARWKANPSYMHTFGITDNYFIIIEQPLCLSLGSMVRTKLQNKPMAGSFRWHHDNQTQINVVSRTTGKLTRKFFADAFFYLHVINQYEDGDYIILDVCCYKDPSMLDCMYVETMKNMHYNPDYAKMFRGRPLRFVLPLHPCKTNDSEENLIKLPCTRAKAYKLHNAINVFPELLCDLGCETPRINYDRHLGKNYRYFYAISSDVDANNPGTIIKVDTVNKTKLTWYEDNCYPSEPIFVEAPNAQMEDEGVILSALVWGLEDSKHVTLLILDASSFKEISRCDFYTPSAVPKCLHGWYLPN